MMRTAKAILVLCFLAAFAAGLMVGIERRQSTDPPSPRGGQCKGFLTSELNLSTEQQDQLRQIWSDTARRGYRGRDERRRALIDERDQAIAKLIRPEDQPQYDEILKNYSDQTAALEKEWSTSFQASVEQTKQILTAEQREKYEKVMQRHQWGRGSRGWHHGDRRQGGGPVSEPPATAPAL